jgi:D-tyrosyl-tRNA(Tyr) deacylase
MRALIQRVTEASVTIAEQETASIGNGLLILLGITQLDTDLEVKKLAEKCVGLRIFEDESEKMNLSLKDINGEALIVSQFTLYGDCKRGRRPSYTGASSPEHAIPLYNLFIQSVKDLGIKTKTGEFGAMMDIKLINSGPVTLMLEI